MSFKSSLLPFLFTGMCLSIYTHSSRAATIDFLPVRAASGLSWDTDYSVPVNENGSLGIGALDNRGTPFLSAALLGYNVSSLAGQYSAINSITLRGVVRDQYPTGISGSVELFRVGDIHAGWSSGATWAASDGSATPWIGGALMNTIQTGSPLASTTITRGSAIGTVYTWVVSGQDAQQLIDDWITGINAGLSLSDTGTAGDYRSNIGGIQGSVAQPTLTVDFVPVPEPAGSALAITACGLLLVRRRRCVS